MSLEEFVDVLKNFSYEVNCDGMRCSKCALNDPFNEEMSICNIIYEIEQILKEKYNAV